MLSLSLRYRQGGSEIQCLIQTTQLNNGYNPGLLSLELMLCTTLLSWLDTESQGLDDGGGGGGGGDDDDDNDDGGGDNKTYCF